MVVVLRRPVHSEPPGSSLLSALSRVFLQMPLVGDLISLATLCALCLYLVFSAFGLSLRGHEEGERLRGVERASEEQ